MSNSSRNFVAAVDLVRGSSRRLSEDLLEMSREFGRECRDVGRELRDMQREIGHRIRSSSLQPLARISHPVVDLIVTPEQDLARLLDDDDCDQSDWPSNPQLSYEDESGCCLSVSPRRLSASIVRSPRTEEILKNVEQALRKTDRALRDMLGLEAKKSSGMVTPKYWTQQVSAPPPSPSNFGVSTSS